MFKGGKMKHNKVPFIHRLECNKNCFFIEEASVLLVPVCGLCAMIENRVVLCLFCEFN